MNENTSESRSSVDRRAASAVLVAFKEHPLEVFEKIKLVEMREVFPPPAAQVQENFAASL